ncbi:MAG TPA: cytochrome C oxidase subunit I [Gammaproteobacteria bacterium]|nr:cytochrome C oxidase subunit I [Gammaproteobacteria bacterium]
MADPPPRGGRFLLPVPEGEAASLARGWLQLGVAALVASGLFSILLVLSRTPALQEIIPWIDFFHVALVVHVDLSVLIWFLAFAGVLWNLEGSRAARSSGRLALMLAAAGTGMIAISPFAGAGDPVMNNYVPVLNHPLFFTGLALFGTGFALLVARTLFVTTTTATDAPLQLALRLAALVAAISLAALLWSGLRIAPAGDDRAYFELLFWGSGHILQFTHTLLLLVVWLWMASACGAKIPLSPRGASALFGLVTLPALLALPIYLLWDVGSAGYRIAFTRLMEFGGLAAIPLGAAAVYGLLRATRTLTPGLRPVRAALLASMLLFTTGGILGFMIRGVNVVIPAHYHGSIVGVTLAFMGLSYYLLPRLGYAQPAVRLATVQPWIYGGGQLLHIAGLAWSGGYGVQRKTAGLAQGLDSLEKIIGMGMMGLGGLIAIVGGLLFVVVALGAMWRGRD